MATKDEGNVLQSSESKEMDDSANDDKEIKKKQKTRKKRMSGIILEQMEFYFSPSNMRNDKFMQNLLSESSDGYVALEVFTKFNQIKNQTTDLKIIAMALKRSAILELSKDKLYVRRRDRLSLEDLPTQEEVDKRVVYVEYLPDTADHEWVQKIFEVVGSVAHVSIPKYKTTKDIKGFAFVEYFKEKDAKRACKYLNNPPSNASDKPGRFPKAPKKLEELKKQVARDEQCEAQNAAAEALKNKEESNGVFKKPAAVTRKGKATRTTATSSKKRSAVAFNSSSDAKKAAVVAANSDCSVKIITAEVDSSHESGLDCTEQKEKPNSAKPSILKTSSGPEVSSLKRCREADDGEGEQGQGGSESKRVRISDNIITVKIPAAKSKRHKRKKHAGKTRVEVPELTVIPKEQWLKLRNEYLSVQKANVSKLKKKIAYMNRVSKGGSKGMLSFLRAPAPVVEPAEKVKKPPPKDIEYVPGVILKFTANKPVIRKDLKEKYSAFGNIAYIDLLDGNKEGHIRCQDAESANKISTHSTPDVTLTLLEANDESSYWDKLRADRENKLSSKKNTKKRGKEKIAEKAERLRATKKTGQHILFN